MTYITCKKVIENKKKVLSETEWEAFVAETMNKLDVFLLNGRIKAGKSIQCYVTII